MRPGISLNGSAVKKAQQLWLPAVTSLQGFPTDEASKEALTVSNLYLEVPYAPNVSEINSALDSYHGSIMTGEMSIDDGIAAMNKAVADLQAQ